MFRLNFRIALRSLWKNKVSSLINTTGLAIGIASCLLLLLYVNYEWSFDKQAKNAANVYQFMTTLRDDSGKEIMTFDGTTTALGPLVKSGIPEVKYLSRVSYNIKALIGNKENGFVKQAKFADPDIFKMYDYEFLSGDSATAFHNPRSVVLTASTALTLFGTTDVLNRVLRYKDEYDINVTGVVKDLPENSSHRFDYLMPWSFYEITDENARQLGWGNYSYVTLVSLRPDAKLAVVNEKIDALVKKNNKSATQPFFLFPLSKLHLYGKFEDGKSVGGAIEQIWLFMGLAFGILLIACINFMNMATAKSEKRAKEVGIKKTIGASRASLIMQFLTESIVLTVLSVVIAIALLEILLPAFNNLLGINLMLSYFSSYGWLAVLGLILVTGLIAGSYPAFYLSSFSPIQTLKRKAGNSSFLTVNLRQLLIIGQFCFTVMLIISTLVIYRQIQFIKNKPVGFDVNALAEMPQEGKLATHYELLRARLLRSGAVTSMFRASTSLLHHSQNFSGLTWPGSTPSENTILFNRVITTYDFTKTAGLKLVSGRDFSEKHASDTAAVIIGTSAVKVMGLKNPLGTVLNRNGQKTTVIGVFQDYVCDTPYKTAVPMIVYFDQKYAAGMITMHLNPANSLHENAALIEAITKEINPSYPVQLSYTDAKYEDLFQKEKRLAVLSNLFGGLAIFISCLGLFGLAAYSAEQRTKEFGIRKVLGASIYSLMQLLSVSFIKMIFVAIVIAVPLAYYVMGRWLEGFEYHTAISWWIALLAAAGTLTIAFVTVSYQAYKTATANPVDALKYE